MFPYLVTILEQVTIILEYLKVLKFTRNNQCIFLIEIKCLLYTKELQVVVEQEPSLKEALYNKDKKIIIEFSLYITKAIYRLNKAQYI